MHDNGEEEEDASPPPSNPNPNPNSMDSSKHTRMMENLKSALLARLAQTQPNKTLTPSQIAAIDLRLAQAFPPSYHTPTHPTYASMIRNAIEELKQEGGSTEGSISEYILKNYEGLPWAHRRYLSHYLDKLCENDEIVCTPSNCYTIPGLISRPRLRLRKKQLRSKTGRKRKEYETDEGDLGGEGNELIGINENEVCFDEEETRVFTENRAKRRRSLVVYEDEEVGGKEGVEREDDVIRNSDVPMIEGQNDKLLEIIGGHEVGKDSEMRQCGSGTGDNGGDEVVGCKEDAELQTGLVGSIEEELMPKERQDEVRTKVLVLDRDDPSKGKTELLGPSTVEKTIPVECVDGVGSETRELGRESGDATLMLVPIQSEKKSALEEDNHIGTSVDVPGETLNKSAIMGRDYHRFRTAELMIVPFKGDTIPAVRKEKRPVVRESVRTIVCALPCEVTGQPKRKQLVYRPRLKRSQKKPLLLLDKSQAASPVGPKLLEYGRSEVSPQTGPEPKPDQTLQDPSILNELPLRTEQAQTPQDPSMLNDMPLLTEQAQTSSPHGTTPMIPDEEGSHKLESEKAKSYLEPPPSSGTQEVMSMDNDDLDVPLKQVLQNCCKQRKLSQEIPTSKVVPLVRESAGVENPAKTMLQRRKKELTATKRKQKQSQRLKKQHKSQAQKCDDLEAGSATAPESGAFLSFHLDEGCDDGKRRHEDQEPHDQERCLLDGQHHDLGENQQKTKDSGLSAELEQTREVCSRESSPPDNQNGPKEEHRNLQRQTEKGDVTSCDPEPVTAATMEEKVAPSKTKESQFMEKRSSGEIASQQEESGCSANHDHEEITAGELGKRDAHPLNLSSEQQIKQPKRPGRGRSQSQTEEPSEPKADGQNAILGFVRTSNRRRVSDNSPGQQLIYEPFSAKQDSQIERDQIEDQQAKDESQVGTLEPDPHFATLVDLDVCVSNQYSQDRDKEVKIERRGRPRKQKEDTKCQQNKQPKKDGRGRSRKKKEETREVAAPLDGTSEPLINEDGDGIPRKEKEETSGNVAAPLDSHDQKKDGPIRQPSTQQRLKKDGRGRPRRQGLVVKEDGAAPLHLRRGRPRKQIGVTKEDAEVAVQGNLGERLQEGPCDSEGQQNKQPKRDGRGRPRKQDRAIEEDASEQKKDERGRPRKPKGETKENKGTMSHQQEEQLNQKEGKQQRTDCQVIFQDSELSGSLEAPLSLGNQSDQDPRGQKQHGQEDKSHKLEREHKPDKEGECPHFPDEQPGKSQGQVHGTPCDRKEVMVCERPQQLEERKEDGGGQLPGSELVIEAVVDQPPQEDKQCLLDEEKEGQSGDPGKTPKQKSAKSKAIEVPLSSRSSLRSRANHQIPPPISIWSMRK